jgi:DNA-binding FadR family transcriptional regulator
LHCSWVFLEVDGRIHIRVGSGIYVLPTPVSEPEPPVPTSAAPIAGPFELLKARALFEGAVAFQAAEIATQVDIRHVDSAISQMRSAQHPGPQSMSLDRAFHTAIADILGNDAVTHVVGDLFDQRLNPYFAQLASYFEDADSWGAALAEHIIIRDHLAANDAEGARAAMNSHLQNSQDRFSKNFGVMENMSASEVELPSITIKSSIKGRISAVPKPLSSIRAYQKTAR